MVSLSLIGLRRLLALALILLTCFASPALGFADEPPLEPELVKEKIAKGALILDVRRATEFEGGHLDRALNIPHDEIADRLGELADYKEREILVYCVSGRRASYAVSVLKGAGFPKVHNAGGLGDLE
jgi:rhodanese-related sulfurtransferase